MYQAGLRSRSQNWQKVGARICKMSEPEPDQTLKVRPGTGPSPLPPPDYFSEQSLLF